jgi:tRNA (guanine-N7-)-methyltransferase
MRVKRHPLATLEFFNTHHVLMTPTPIDLEGDIILEIGSGKGKFITELATLYPNKHFVAFEVQPSVCYHLVLKKEALQLKNLSIILDDAKHVKEYFKPHSIKQIWLNFSDPWPKTKHHKRRLTASHFLKDYQSLLSLNGELHLRTDHEALFLFSCETIKQHFKHVQCDTNAIPYVAMSEYEMKKRLHGPIYYLKAEGTHELL